MSLGEGLRRLFGRAAPHPVIDPPGYRGVASHRVTPPPPPPPGAAPTVVGRPSGPQVRLVMTDGSVQELPADEELEQRAAYLVRSMLSPAPPPPPA